MQRYYFTGQGVESSSIKQRGREKGRRKEGKKEANKNSDSFLHSRNMLTF